MRSKLGHESFTSSSVAPCSSPGPSSSSATGIWPINCNIFPDEAFAGAEVSEQPDPHMAAGEVDSPDDVGVAYSARIRALA